VYNRKVRPKKDKNDTMTSDVAAKDAAKKTPIFSPEDVASLNPTNIPKHIAIIPDGNRRWAKKRFFDAVKSYVEGHIHGAENVVTIVQAAKELGVKKMTIYGFSTENWKRPKSEVIHLMHTIQSYLERYQKKLIENDIRLTAIGNCESLDKSLLQVLQKTIEMTKECNGFDCILAVNYGGRNELLRAVKTLLSDAQHNNIEPSAIDETLFSSYLDTKGLDDPDLIIRTSGEMRISNFLLWQSAYSELYIDETNWPDFTPNHLLKALVAYQGRERRKGGGSL